MKFITQFCCLIFLLLLHQMTYAATAQAKFTYGVVGEYKNAAHQPASFANFSTLNIQSVTLTAISDNGTFGGTQGNDLDVALYVTLGNGTVLQTNGAINWRETNGNVINAIGIIIDSDNINDGFALSNNHEKTYLLRLSTSNKTYSDENIKGNAANNSEILAETFTLLNTEAESQGTAGGTPAPTKSTLSASPTSVIADGVNTSTVTVQLKDASGNDMSVSGQTVTLSSSLGALSSITDNNDGTYSATVLSTTAGTANISGKLNGETITSTASVNFTTATPATYNISGSVTRGSSSSGVADITVKIYSNTDTNLANVLQTTTSDFQGNYTFTGLSNGDYQVVFVSTNSLKIKAVSNIGRNGQNSNSAAKSVNRVENITVNNASVTDIDAILVDPAGVIYDSTSRSPVALVTVSFVYDNAGTETIVPNTWLDQTAGGANTQTTGSDGKYAFVLNGNAPTTLTTYSIKVTPPNTHTFQSTAITPTANFYDPGLGGGVVAIQTQETAPQSGDATDYYLNFELIIGTSLATTSNGVINNHIPIDPVPISVNNTPTATSQALTTAEDTDKSITLVGSDADGDLLTYSVETQPSNGTLSGTAPNVTYTPDANYTGSDSFTFKVNDGTLDSTVATVTVTVTATNDAPTANSFTVVTDENTPKDITLSGDDLDGDELVVERVTQPANGTLVCSEDSCVYSPNDSFDGIDSFTYRVTDGTTVSEIGTVMIIVNDVVDDNLPPIANNDIIVIENLVPVEIDVLANDNDPESGALQIIEATTGFGSVSIVNSMLIFTPIDNIEGVVEINYVIEDEKGLTANAVVIIDIQVEIDSLLPVITLPTDLCGGRAVDGNELYTRIDIGQASAVDRFGNTLPVSTINGATRFPPGINLVYWQATDADGNTAIKTQRVCVNPLISIAKDQTVTEGETVKVGIYLNGISPEYPLLVPFTVSGSAQISDHTAFDGVIEITSGTETFISFDILNDAEIEADETVIFALTDVNNLGPKNIHTATITEGNIAPKTKLSVSQNNQERLTVTQDGGMVTVSSSIFDPNVFDKFEYFWEESSGNLTNQATQINQYMFDPAIVDLGLYKFTLTVNDNGTPVGRDLEYVYIEVVESLATLSNQDSDGDLIPDYLEGYQDNDADGVPDYLDRYSECNVLLEELAVQDGFIVEGEPGICLRLGNTAFNSETGGLHITDNDVNNAQVDIVADVEAVNIGGIFDFIAYDLPDIAQSVAVALPQRNPIPRSAVFRKYRPDSGWGFFVENNDNQIFSTAGEPGYCPPPRSALWTPGLTEGYWCVQLVIQDGGPNDNDGLINGVIEDPGYVGVTLASNTLPEAQDDARITAFNDDVTIDLNALISDEDGDSLTISSVTPTFGAASLVGNVMTYTPPQDFAGEVTITYGVTDGQGGTTQAQITITFLPPNYPPRVDEIATNAIEQCTPSQPIDVLSTTSDPESDAVTILSASSPNGSVMTNADGKLVFTPDCDFFGTATINFVVEDSAGNQVNGSFTMVVNQVIEVVAVTKSTGGSMGVFALYLAAALILLRRSKNWNKAFVVTIFSTLALFVVKAYAKEQCDEDQLGEVETTCKKEFQWPTGFFFAGDVGHSSTDVSASDLDQDFINQGITAESLSVDTSDTSYGFGIGYQFNQYFALDWSYRDFGDRQVEFTGSTLADDESAFFAAADDVFPMTGEGLSYGATFSLPFAEKWKVNASLRYLEWERDYISVIPEQRGQASREGKDLTRGLSISYASSPKTVVSLSYEITKLAHHDVDNIYLGLQYFPFASEKRIVQKTTQHKVVEEPKEEVIEPDMTVNLLVLFELNSAVLTQTNMVKIEEFANFVQAFPNLQILIEGHTDVRGSDEYNQWLSTRRANAVATTLVEMFDIKKSRIESIGYGETQLVNLENTKFAHQENRRVLAKLYK